MFIWTSGWWMKGQSLLCFLIKQQSFDWDMKTLLISIKFISVMMSLESMFIPAKQFWIQNLMNSDKTLVKLPIYMTLPYNPCMPWYNMLKTFISINKSFHKSFQYFQTCHNHSHMQTLAAIRNHRFDDLFLRAASWNLKKLLIIVQSDWWLAIFISFYVHRCQQFVSCHVNKSQQHE